MLKKLIIGLALSLSVAQPAKASTAEASVYDEWYDGRPTASGEAFRYHGLSAAHPWLRFGRYRVSYRNRSVTVRLNDRLNLPRLDLSCGAAYHLFKSCYTLKTVTYQWIGP
jgi:rare lipoprotein A